MIALTVRVALPLSFVVVTAVTASGQTPASEPPPKAREGKAEFALITTTGNAESRTLGTAGEVTLRPPRWVLSAKVGFVRHEAEGVVSAKSLTSLERASRVLSTRLQGFGQHGYLRDLFAGV